jgi:hypothetical protein
MVIKKTAKKTQNNRLLVVLDHFSLNNGLYDLVWGLFLSLDNCPLAVFYVPFWVHLGVPKWLKENMKNLFSACFGPFLPNEWA